MKTNDTNNKSQSWMIEATLKMERRLSRKNFISKIDQTSLQINL